VQMGQTSVKPADRRQTPRTKLVEIAYIGMGPENGGLVLDVSDGGLSFHAVAPVKPAETIHFLLSLRGHSRIEGAGEVVWANELRTICGLRFTSLSAGAREHLNNWTTQSRMPAAARAKPVSSAPPAPPQTEESPASLASQSATNSAPVFAIPPASAIYLSEPAEKTLWGGQLFLWFIFGIMGAMVIGSAYLYGLHVGKSEIGSVALPAASPDGQTDAPALAAAPLPASSDATDASSTPTVVPSVPTVAPSTPNITASVPSGVLVNASKTDETPANSASRPGAEGHAPSAPDQHAELALEAGKSELAAALVNLNGDNGKRDSSSAVRLLWAAVGNGNSAAEVILSDLYVSGDGVAKNCEQGRILLVAATKSGNAQAKVKLDELNANGCP